MIVAITSKGGGAGCSTISLVSTIILSKHFNRKCCLVDLRDNNDLVKLIKIRTQASINNLISDFGINNKFTTLEENTVEYNGIDVIPGVTTPVRNYLLKKTTKIKELLQELEKRYDVVVVDISDSELYQTLLSIDLKILPVNVLEQNVLLISKYKEEMSSGFLKGIVVINKLDNKVWPYDSLFKKAFSKDRIFLLPYSPDLRSSVNREGVRLDKISSTEFFNQLTTVCKYVDGKIAEYLSIKGNDSQIDLSEIFETAPKHNNKKSKNKRGFLSSLFGGKRGVKNGR